MSTHKVEVRPWREREGLGPEKSVDEMGVFELRIELRLLPEVP